MANEYWKMRGSYKTPLPIARDRELLVDMNNGDVYFGWNGSNVPLSNVAELQTLVGLLLAKKILKNWIIICYKLKKWYIVITKSL